MADHPLRPATDRRLGRPLPHQLANQTQAPPIAPGLTPALLQRDYAVLARVSSGYPPLQGRFLRVTHPSATRHPCVLLHTVLPFDLHVLSIPPAFNLSQDQTLHFILENQISVTRYILSLLAIYTQSHFYIVYFNLACKLRSRR